MTVDYTKRRHRNKEPTQASSANPGKTKKSGTTFRKLIVAILLVYCAHFLLTNTVDWSIVKDVLKQEMQVRGMYPTPKHEDPRPNYGSVSKPKPESDPFVLNSLREQLVSNVGFSASKYGLKLIETDVFPQGDGVFLVTTTLEGEYCNYARLMDQLLESYPIDDISEWLIRPDKSNPRKLIISFKGVYYYADLANPNKSMRVWNAAGRSMDMYSNIYYSQDCAPEPKQPVTSTDKTPHPDDEHVSKPKPESDPVVLNALAAHDFREQLVSYLVTYAPKYGLKVIEDGVEVLPQGDGALRVTVALEGSQCNYAQLMVNLLQSYPIYGIGQSYPINDIRQSVSRPDKSNPLKLIISFRGVYYYADLAYPNKIQRRNSVSQSIASYSYMYSQSCTTEPKQPVTSTDENPYADYEHVSKPKPESYPAILYARDFREQLVSDLRSNAPKYGLQLTEESIDAQPQGDGVLGVAVRLEGDYCNYAQLMVHLLRAYPIDDLTEWLARPDTSKPIKLIISFKGNYYYADLANPNKIEQRLESVGRHIAMYTYMYSQSCTPEPKQP